MAGGGPPVRYLRTAVDALAYGLVVTAAAVAVALVAGLATGTGLFGAKVLLLLVGLAAMALAVFRLWPTEPTAGADVTVDRAGGPPGTPVGPTRIEDAAAAVPPLRWMQRPRRRLSPPAKVFLTSLFLLAASFLLEVALGTA